MSRASKTAPSACRTKRTGWYSWPHSRQKCTGVKAFVRVPGEELLTIGDHLACAGWLDRRIDVACA